MGRKDISGEGENAKTWILICLNHSIELKTCNSSLIMQQPELLQWQEPVLWKCINHQHMKVKTHCWLLWFKPHKLCGESWNPHLPMWTHSYMYCMNCATKGITNKVPLYKLEVGKTILFMLLQNNYNYPEKLIIFENLYELYLSIYTSHNVCTISFQINYYKTENFLPITISFPLQKQNPIKKISRRTNCINEGVTVTLQLFSWKQNHMLRFKFLTLCL